MSSVHLLWKKLVDLGVQLYNLDSVQEAAWRFTEQAASSPTSSAHQVPPPCRAARGKQEQRRLEAEDIVRLVTSYLDGATARQLAEQFGINDTTVYAHLAREGVPKRRYRKLRGDLLAQAIELYQAGQSLRAVAEQVGVGRESVRIALIEAGVLRRRLD